MKKAICVFILACFLLCGEVLGLELKSSAFKDGEFVPEKFTCLGENISPPLRWSGAPDGTRSYALIMDDPDAPRGTWVHWVIYNIPENISSLEENLPRNNVLADGSKQGANSFNWIGYGGPCPPSGPRHRYIFTLYALDTRVNIPPGATKGVLLMRMKGHVLAQGVLTGLFKR
jgi:Raf kinase inhibitor-like YbhB/YbcL family protein